MGRILLGLAIFGSLSSSTKLHPELQRQLTETNDILIHVKPMDDNLHRNLKEKKFTSRLERTRFLYQSLKLHSEVAQRDIHRLLSEHPTFGENLWLINAISVPNASRKLVQALDQHDAIEEIAFDGLKQFNQTIHRQLQPVENPHWALQNANVNQVHDELGVRGENIVIGVIDSGFELDFKPI